MITWYDAHLLENVTDGGGDLASAVLGNRFQILIDVDMDKGLAEGRVAGVEQVDALRACTQCMETEGSGIGAAIQDHRILGIRLYRLAVLPLVAVESTFLPLPGNHFIIQSVFTETDGIEPLGRSEVLAILIIQGGLTELFGTGKGAVYGNQHQRGLQQAVQGGDDYVAMIPGNTGADDDSQHGSIYVDHHTRQHVGFRENDAEGGGAAGFVLKEGTSSSHAFGDGLGPPGLIGDSCLVPTEQPKRNVAVLIVPSVGDERAIVGFHPAQTGFQCRGWRMKSSRKYPGMMA